MDLTLSRFRIDAQGAFSYLKEDDNGNQVAVTASHTYLEPDGMTYAPVTRPGRYLCVRGTHTIHNPTPENPQNMTTFETFEITGVTGHTGVLFHWGNLPREQSQGCELMGATFGALNDEEAVLNSVATFKAFMQLQEGIEQFWLTVL